MKELEEVPKEQWPSKEKNLTGVYKNDRFLVQVYISDKIVRLSVNRIEVDHFELKRPIWKEGITWDELQEVKDLLGYEDCWFVELYPPKEFIVNAANMRHLWVIPEPEFGWKKK